MEATIGENQKILRQLRSNLEACILGKSDEIALLLTSMLAEGHVLLEDVPGTGKTVLMKALARSIQGEYRRIQCNPDLLPTDITGVAIYHPKHEQFIFRPGPVMTNILLTDEINRATTKTQAALLEAMEERHVTVDGECHPLPVPFLLLATQNPIDFEGTYSLPEAQLDRFMMKFSIGYPNGDAEKQMVRAQKGGHPLERLEIAANVAQIVAIQEEVKNIHMDDAIMEYVVEIVRRTREHPAVFLGASPRATLSLVQAARAYAYLQEREYVIPDDVKHLAAYVLGHRLILNSEARIDGMTPQQLLESIFQQVRVPVRLEK